jgi:hypothetical protein
MAQKLFIYGTGDPDNVDQALTRIKGMDDVVALPVAKQKEFLAQMDRLVSQKKVFDRVLFQTHGSGGAIAFADDEGTPDATHIYDWDWDGFKGHQYHKLFPTYTRIYFDGCSVASGAKDGSDPQKGVKFLNNAGSVLLRLQGGEVFAWDSPGYAIPGDSKPWVDRFLISPLWGLLTGGQTIHFTGKLVKFRFGPGGGRIADSE